MTHDACLIGNCTFHVYAPAGTGGLCKPHFLSFVVWRRRKGPTMFHKYAAMTMNERDGVLAEWSKTLASE
jgi:hypothetical protein